jgi:hypothetical protein
MMSRRLLLFLVLAGVVSVTLPATVPTAQAPRAAASPSLPAQLGDQEFWRLSADLSEAHGYFQSENLVSNEHTFQYVVPALKAAVRPGGVYFGVAPDQNFTYIIAVQPKIAFIVDIRRGNLLHHLLYKAIIELSADRAEFLSRLFSKKRPAGLTAKSTVRELFEAYGRVRTTEELGRQNLRAVEDHLTKKHGFGLSAEDLQQLETIYFEFYWQGPQIRYSTNSSGAMFGRGGGRNFPSYEDLMVQTDLDGRHRGYLATEEGFRFLKTFQEKNLLVPVVGNFAGPKALRAAGRWVRERGATVSAFYVSNVEQYLFQDGIFADFARNIATLPLDASSTFIRSVSTRYGYLGSHTWTDGRASALDLILPFVRDFNAGRIREYRDVNARSK